jgi:hypothetical protein
MKNCGTTVQNALMLCAGVEKAVVDFPNGTASIWGGGLEASDLIDAVECVGFDAALRNKGECE